jgi:ribosomal-protein-alanine N-acetyltransferase
MVEIETPRLILREFRLEDFDAVHEYASDPEVVKYMTWGPNTMEETRAFIIGAMDKKLEVPRLSYELAVTLRGDLIGGCGLTITNLKMSEGEIGYCLRYDMWNRGIGTEVARSLIYYGFKALGLTKIRAKCDTNNRASFRVMEKNGMRLEDKVINNLKIRGKYRDTYIYCITLNEWISNVTPDIFFS